jgi:hypothetical protein
MPEQFRQVIDSGDANRLHGSGFAGVSGRHDQLAQVGIARERSGDRERAAHRHERAVERQLADEDAAENGFRRQKLGDDEDADGNRQVERRSFLLHVRRREVYGEMALRQPVAAMAQRGTDARIRFARGGVRKSDQSEAGLLGDASIDFDDNSYCFNPEGRGTPYLGKHGG